MNDDVAALDGTDPLARFRAEFTPPSDQIYLAGHSLGPPSAAVLARLDAVARGEWRHTLVAGWHDHDWIGAPLRLGAKIAPLIGAARDEALVADSTSVNLFKLIGALAQSQPERKIVLIERGEFPTDMHIAQGAVSLLGQGRRVVFAPPDGLADHIDDQVALVVASHVHYRDGRIRDMAALQARADAVGADFIWDVSHSVGVVDIDLAAAGARFAVGCGYKYLNGGPGAPAFLYVARARQAGLANPISGWLGAADPFAFADLHAPADGIARFQAGTPSILAMAALEASLDLLAQSTPAQRRAKCLSLQRVFLARLGDAPGLTLLGPHDEAIRGGHLAFSHPRADAVVQALAGAGLIRDHRPPDVLRFAFSPLTLTHAEAARGGELLRATLGASA